MKRREFISLTGTMAASLPIVTGTWNVPSEETVSPMAITMWDFSWLERRWPGAGYEHWDKALDELAERGYNAIRIDAFPHFFNEDPQKEYTLIPLWNTQVWGSPGLNKVKVFPALIDFIRECAIRKIKIAFSSWFREDENNVRMKLNSPEKLAHAWLCVLDTVRQAGLLNSILYVDLCNEWTGPSWCPFFVNDPPEAIWTGWHTPKSTGWMQEAISILKQKYPQIPFTFSFCGEVTADAWSNARLSMLDLLELHIWMTSAYGGEFYKTIGYKYDHFSDEGYKKIQLFAESLYHQKKEYWQAGLKSQIRSAAGWSKQSGLPLATTECWGVVDYKDYPLLNWDWIKELCLMGINECCNTGRWLLVASSNFCGPQFAGMWSDVKWHKTVTNSIKKAPIDPDLKTSLLYQRLLI